MQVLSGLMEDRHVRNLLGLDGMPIADIYSVCDQLFAGTGHDRPSPVTRSRFETFFVARHLGLLGASHLVLGKALDGGHAAGAGDMRSALPPDLRSAPPPSSAALSSVRDLMGAERRLSELPPASPQLVAEARTARCGQVGPHLLAAMAAEMTPFMPGARMMTPAGGVGASREVPRALPWWAR